MLNDTLHIVLMSCDMRREEDIKQESLLKVT